MNTPLKGFVILVSMTGMLTFLQIQRNLNPWMSIQVTGYLQFIRNQSVTRIVQKPKPTVWSCQVSSGNSTEEIKLRNSLRNSPLCHNRRETEIIMFTTFINAPGRWALQRVVIDNWSQHYPSVKCVVFVNFADRNSSTGFEELVKYSIQKNWTVLPITDVNEHGTPFLMPWFKLVITAFEAKLYGFVNGDNIFDDGLMDTLRTVITILPKLNDSVFVTGMRRDIEWTNKVNGSTLWKSHVIREVVKNTGNPVTFAEDYFFVGKQFPYQGFRNVVVGRSGVDNYLVLRAKELDIVTIDASSTVVDIHIRPTEGRVQGAAAVDGHFNYAVVGKVTWWMGNTDTTLMKTTRTTNGTVTIVCRHSPCFNNKVKLTDLAGGG